MWNITSSIAGDILLEHYIVYGRNTMVEHYIVYCWWYAAETLHRLFLVICCWNTTSSIAGDILLEHCSVYCWWYTAGTLQRLLLVIYCWHTAASIAGDILLEHYIVYCWRYAAGTLHRLFLVMYAVDSYWIKIIEVIEEITILLMTLLQCFLIVTEKMKRLPFCIEFYLYIFQSFSNIVTGKNLWYDRLSILRSASDYINDRPTFGIGNWSRRTKNQLLPAHTLQLQGGCKTYTAAASSPSSL